MSKSSKSKDAHLAWEIHNQMNRFDITGITENAAFPNDSKENYKPRTLIDNTLEIIDPTPNIHTLFVQFNKKFFSNKLLSVEVKWSHRMTSCAGTCTFNTGSRYCVIALSSPLLKLRPRKDLVETLLHEMIHAFLFVTNNNRDRDGHGPEFCKHMHRINQEAGTKITVYHTFHAEVKLYQQHWWRCNGPCQKKHPFFGMVRRSMNRAPGPNDFWFKEHQSSCGGQFIKVREPEKVGKKGKKAKDDSKNPNLDKWLTPDNKSKGTGTGLKTKGGSSVYTVNKWNANANSNEPGISKLGNTTNNVHGFGTGGPGSSSGSSSSATTSSANKVSFTGTLGGSGSGRSRLLQLFDSPQSSSKENNNEKKESNDGTFSPKTVRCPICKDLILEKIANEHIDSCLVHKKEMKPPLMNSTPENNSKSTKITQNGNKFANCPVCNKEFSLSKITEHIDTCLTENDDKNPSPIVINDSDSDFESTPAKKRKISDFFNNSVKKETKNTANCPVCKKDIKIDEMNRHLDECLIEIDDINEAGPSKVDNSGNIDKNKVHVDVKKETAEKCLICNKILDPDVPLTQHLDDCLKGMFNADDSFTEQEEKINDSKNVKANDLIEIDDSTSDEESSDEEKKNRFPCPVCLTLIPQGEMNKHLDSCVG
ncbi:DNA-dependent metalloprotease dvc-1-like isoform X2 [Leptopilina heterotoma]|uniref:DNA-dependent metalloprotease dvc-1-like isoform X2 n=1 Tax=Leptopilina heterotoma TaxID=63436 RepID=UPI001CA882A7|nr:DNA-dependent metalloprotease dvc-1-like isoform X2 [Leptopilina heterotoma]